MADHVVMPPVSCCQCALCMKRRWDLQLARQIELELLEAVERDLTAKRLTVLLEDSAEHEPPVVRYAARRNRHGQPTGPSPLKSRGLALTFRRVE